MTTYRYTSPENAVVQVIDSDGISRSSALASTIPEGTTIEAYTQPIPSEAECLKQIDADTDAIYRDTLGNRGPEYTDAAKDAGEFKAAGYTGQVPHGVQSWATAKSWTATQAADDILVNATAWTTAKDAIRATRLARKEQVRTAANEQSRASAMAAWSGFVAYIRNQLGV